jgi:hypothetical protein
MTRTAMLAALVACLSPLAVSACNDAPRGGNEPASTAPAPPASSTKPSPSAIGSAAAPKKSAPVTWSGTYQASPGSLYVYDGGEWKGVHFRGDDAATGLGEGPLSLTIDPATRELRGTASGPLGDVILAGVVSRDLATDGAISFSVLRKDPSDHGLTGTGVGHLGASTLTGTMRLSRGDAHVIRDVTFSLTPAP